MFRGASSTEKSTAPPATDGYTPIPGPAHEWQSAVPDTSLLPPPPILGHERSAANNATEEEARRGEDWCLRNPFAEPGILSVAAHEALLICDVGIVRPRTYIGVLTCPHPGVWTGKTKSDCPDSCISGTIPFYSVLSHSPLQTQTKTIVYFEVRILSQKRKKSGLALGFAASPYPSFRLPGWHRGSLAVHGDDGSRFVNDTCGGKPFTQPFKAGETLGIGMSFTLETLDPSVANLRPMNVEVFFTRDGIKSGNWDLHEEGDAVDDLPVTGLEGYNDLFPVVGVFGKVEFKIIFQKEEWLYRPER